MDKLKRIGTHETSLATDDEAFKSYIPKPLPLKLFFGITI